MRLIVTEKDSAAKKIAQILGEAVAVKEHGRGRQKVRSYRFEWQGDEAVAIGLRGHVMETVFPRSYKRWSLKTLGDMIRRPDLAWVVDGGAVSTLAALRTAAKGADEVIIATDYDREGELIGHEALEILRGDALLRHPADPADGGKAGRGRRAAGGKAAAGAKAAAPKAAATAAASADPRVKAMLPAAVVDRHHRARYSALTAEEVKAAFAKPSTVDFSLAEAAHSRQDIDLVWGAVLTRFMSLASYRYGSEFLSVGRVQTPTLRLVVDRELERRAFVPVPYWELGAVIETADGPLAVAHAGGRFDDAEAAETARARAAAAEVAVVTGYKAQPRQVAPPPPFNTTALMSAASGVGVSPARAMRAAESLYLDGLISYPRTDNTVYPPSLDLKGSLHQLSSHKPVAGVAARLAAQERLTPTRGKRRTTDHPPIYPVDVPRGELSGDAAKVYDLVVRRFLATLLPAAVIEGQRLDVGIGGEPFLARGSRVASPGFLEVYERYAAKRDRPLPAVTVGDEFPVLELQVDAKETQPPSRYGQGPLIEKMEELGLGTKATRADIIQHLYDRNYVRDNPVEPTELGVALIAAFDVAMQEAPLDISSSAMTRELEGEMDRISEGELRREEVVADSQRMLEEAWRLLDRHIDEVRDRIRSGVREDLTLGVCKNCGGQLRVLRGKTGKRFAACVGKEGEAPGPDGRRGCGQTFPLPQRGTIMPTGKTCAECGWPEIKVLGAGGRGRPWVLCLDMDCPTKAAYKARSRSKSHTTG
ncbi:MAG: DNA topoisomerase I [Thermoleophilia bacterium]|nr:DNA topoisomerase I [Thermoleophilia bacterium]